MSTVGTDGGADSRNRREKRLLSGAYGADVDCRYRQNVICMSFIPTKYLKYRQNIERNDRKCKKKKSTLARSGRSHIDALAKPGGGGGQLGISSIILSFVGTCKPTVAGMSFVPTKYRKEWQF